MKHITDPALAALYAGKARRRTSIRTVIAALKKADKPVLAKWLEAEWNKKNGEIEELSKMLRHTNGPAHGW